MNGAKNVQWTVHECTKCDDFVKLSKNYILNLVSHSRHYQSTSLLVWQHEEILSSYFFIEAQLKIFYFIQWYKQKKCLNNNNRMIFLKTVFYNSKGNK